MEIYVRAAAVAVPSDKDPTFGAIGARVSRDRATRTPTRITGASAATAPESVPSMTLAQSQQIRLVSNQLASKAQLGKINRQDVITKDGSMSSQSRQRSKTRLLQ